METYNLAMVTKKIYQSGFKMFNLKTLRDILEVKKESSFFSVLKRLLKNNVLLKIEKDKYVLKDAKINDFALANFLYSPSYISFETALNFYGILSQFPYEITSATVKKSKQKIVEGKTLSYIHLKKNLFWGFKKNGFLIAEPEKALLDQLYLSAKGLKKTSLDEYDLTIINFKKLKEYFKKFPKTKQFFKTRKSLEKFLEK